MDGNDTETLSATGPPVLHVYSLDKYTPFTWWFVQNIESKDVVLHGVNQISKSSM